MLLAITLSSALAFCRVVIGLVFAISSISKARNIAQFKQTIAGFNVLPRSWHSPLAFSFVCGEFVVVALIVAGSSFLVPGFVLALFLLFIFCAALLSVLAKGLKTSCNCFGPREKQVSAADIWRNVGFMLCALGGCILFWQPASFQVHTNVTEWILAGLIGVIFVAIWLHIGEIVQLFHLD